MLSVELRWRTNEQVQWPGGKSRMISDYKPASLPFTFYPVTIPFQTTGTRDSIDEPALNQIWSEMTTEEKVVSDEYCNLKYNTRMSCISYTR